MFRGKESSNRIELSQLVQELLNFGVLGSPWLWGWVDGVGGRWMGWGGGWGVPPTHVHMHGHTCMVNMIISCKWPPPLGESPMMSYAHTCTCMCMGAPSHHPQPTSTHPPAPGGPPESVKIQYHLN